MTHWDHVNKALQDFPPPWKIETYGSGECCWCRMIVTQDYDTEDPYSDENDKRIVVPSAMMDESLARLIVEAVNQTFNRPT